MFLEALHLTLLSLLLQYICAPSCVCVFVIYSLCVVDLDLAQIPNSIRHLHIQTDKETHTIILHHGTSICELRLQL